jgi:hypothetical protein
LKLNSMTCLSVLPTSNVNFMALIRETHQANSKPTGWF